MLTIFYATVCIGSIIMLVWLARGPFYVPTRRKHVSRIIEMLELKPGEKAVDLGSGDGRLLIALAEAGAQAHGYEHNPLLVMRSKQLLRKHGLEGKVFVSMSNFWNLDVSSFDAVVIYGIPYIMERLQIKLQKELRPGARVVSYSFPFPSWEPAETHKRIYLYRK
ncbi:MAG: methyltransferase domain-containing protein [bacterium]|nr:methyltransferase domain-containing protein [bacterium]